MAGDAGFTFGAGTGLVRAQSVALNDTHSFSPHLLNEFRFGISRFNINVTSIDYGSRLAETVGIPGVVISDTTTAMSQITFAGGGFRNVGANGNQPLITALDTFQYYDNLTWISGGHTVKGGGSFTQRRRNVYNVDNIVGTFQFNQNLTSNCTGIASGCAITPGTGFDGASFMLGFPSSETRTYQLGTVGERRPEFAVYIQDDWRVNRRLTLNVGLRYDLFVPYVEVYDRQSNFETSSGKFVLASEDATINGVKVGRRLQRTPTKDFAPRVGFAYDLRGNGRTLLRAGYGMFYNNPLTGTSSSKVSNPPFLLAQAFTTTLLPTLRLSAGLPPPPTVDPNRPPSGSTRSIFDIDFRDGRAQQWNFNVQQQFGKDYLVELAYVGSKGDHLVLKRDINVAPPTVGVTNSDVNRPYIRLSPLLRSLSQVQSRGWSKYHALQAKFSKRFSSGLVFMNSYTWGKTQDIVSDTEGATLNPYNFNYDRAVADFDIKHNFVSTVNYELPFGRGAGGVARTIVGGWQINMILLARTGLPFTVTQQQGMLSTGTGNRPNRIRSGKFDNPTPDRWWDTTAFSPTADNTGTYGNSGRNILRQPNQTNVDLSLIKNTRIGERFQHQFRVEAFNAFNHPQFGAPGRTLGASDQGVISSLLFNTPMRQVQLVMKLSF
ncbi:MAG TPA: TonB-dependent receptor [Bryobacteraceae bacterium]|nr:TonB-dependent receptor [Bryobacteraceae bacterium]